MMDELTILLWHRGIVQTPSCPRSAPRRSLVGPVDLHGSSHPKQMLAVSSPTAGSSSPEPLH